MERGGDFSAESERQWWCFPPEVEDCQGLDDLIYWRQRAEKERWVMLGAAGLGAIASMVGGAFCCRGLMIGAGAALVVWEIGLERLIRRYDWAIESLQLVEGKTEKRISWLEGEEEQRWWRGWWLVMRELEELVDGADQQLMEVADLKDRQIFMRGALMFIPLAIALKRKGKMKRLVMDEAWRAIEEWLRETGEKSLLKGLVWARRTLIDKQDALYTAGKA